MEFWVMDQEKNRISCVRSVDIRTVETPEGFNYHIYGSERDSNNEVLLARYFSKEQAMQELNRLFMYISVHKAAFKFAPAEPPVPLM